MIRRVKRAFSLAEAMITITIVSLVMAVTMPILIKSQSSPSEAPWKYVTLGDLSQNAAVYTVLGGSAVSVFGDKRVPVDSNIGANKSYIYASKINPKIAVVARNHSFNPLISRHLLDFYEKHAILPDTYENIGKVSFDSYYNLAMGKNALDNIIAASAVTFSGAQDGDSWTSLDEPSNMMKNRAALNTAVGQYAMAGNRKHIAYGGSSETEYPTRDMNGVGNTALGAFALRRNTSGNFNTAVGAYALESSGTSSVGQGSGNTVLGYGAFRFNLTGSNNIVIGQNAASNAGNNIDLYNTYPKDNIAIGSNSLNSNNGTANIAIGTNALRFSLNDNYSIAIGYEALKGGNPLTNVGSGNTAIGYHALTVNEGGTDNTAIGYETLISNSTGSRNIAVGSGSLKSNTDKGDNIAIGYNALMNNSTGQQNIAIGTQSLELGNGGSNNTAVGYMAANNSGGNNNTAVGHNALASNEIAADNTAVGSSALASNGSAGNNTAIGSHALENSAGSASQGNTAVGAYSMRRLNSGNNNTAVGWQAMYADPLQERAESSKILGSKNTAVGSCAGAFITSGEENTAIGYFSLAGVTTGQYNTAVGTEAMAGGVVTGAGHNVAVGKKSLYNLSTGQQNVAVGNFALGANQTGKDNVAIGYDALKSNKGGGKNIAIGTGSLYSYASSEEESGSNIAIGYQSLYSNGASKNIAIGKEALYSSIHGTDNIAIGNGSLYSSTTASHNIAIGTDALKNATYGHNIAIGYNASGNDSSISNRLYISVKENKVGHEALIYGGYIYGINSSPYLVFNVQPENFIIGGNPDNEYNQVVTKQTLSDMGLSDRRLKNILGDNTAGLKEILQLQVKNFTMKKDRKKEIKVGVIAQDLQKIFPNSVTEGLDGYLRIKRDEIFYALVNAVKELHSMIQDIIAKIAGLDEKIKLLEDRNKLNEEKITLLEQQNKMFEERLSALESGKSKSKSKSLYKPAKVKK